MRPLPLIVALTLLVLLLPTHNSTADAWYYAACVRYGHDLLLPHHLLYNAVGWLWARLLTPLQVAPLAAMLALNALAYGGALLTLRDMLRRLGCSPNRTLALLLLAGSSFGMLRFATENETYMLPLLLSLLSSRSWLKHLQTRKRMPLLAAGGWAAAACLLHQLHILWAVGLLIGTGLYSVRRWRAVLVFAAPGLLLVPLAYWLALGYWHLPPTPDSLLRFVLHDFITGSAAPPTSPARVLLLTAANFVRTFAQLHGSTLALLQKLPWLVAVPVAGAALVGWSLLSRRRKKQLTAATTRHEPAEAFSIQNPTLQKASFRRTHSLIFLLHLLFAAWASGNAEFMVMLPTLLALVAAATNVAWPARPVAALGGALLLWNLAFGLLPNYLLDFHNQAPLLARVRQEPQTLFLLDNHNLALNHLHYLTGHDGQPNVLPAPAVLAEQRHWTPQQLQQWLRAQLRAGRRLSTDALGGPRLLDRARLTRQAADAELLQGFRQTRRDSFPTFFGPRYLTDLR